MTSIATKALSQEMFDAAFALLEWAEGNTELARSIWSEAFEEAERIDHNQSLGEPDERDFAVARMTERFEQAEAARQKFHVVKDG